MYKRHDFEKLRSELIGGRVDHAYARRTNESWALFHIPDLVESLLVCGPWGYLCVAVTCFGKLIILLLCFYQSFFLKLKVEDEKSIINYAFHCMCLTIEYGRLVNSTTLVDRKSV
ncbi:hypothetical protein K503DRAFT_613198 [Rhizopogon vinicolor AM-OR11-026]|uniref:Uncharacterized protein n=1 Tax=Rhizopogon vinicolor AM-OR11-026 TaxID=1314800 RepID=A0A1B7NGJ0_9AGAM|nr:hypothetical protein K503DRAFT_613198 [Rhizopogon vinicolor AM-OR11-026]